MLGQDVVKRMVGVFWMVSLPRRVGIFDKLGGILDAFIQALDDIDEFAHAPI